MKVYIPKALLITAKAFSKYKTPQIRSAGFTEQSGQKRGHGDLCDTVASMMMALYIGSNNLPCKYQIALWQGDDFDLEVNKKSINLKASSWQPNTDDFEVVKYHMGIKESEFHKINDIYQQVMVHLDDPKDPPHIHFCGWIASDSLSLPLNKNKYYKEIPNTGGSKGLWIPSTDLQSFSTLLTKVR